MAEEKSVAGAHGAHFVVERTGAYGASRRLIQSEAIFGGETSAIIAHGQELYTLRITKQGKLVLNK